MHIIKPCVECKHFTDGRYSRVYVSPQCNQRGQDAAAFMREFVCGLEGRLWEPKDADTQAKATSCQHSNS